MSPPNTGASPDISTNPLVMSNVNAFSIPSNAPPSIFGNTEAPSLVEAIPTTKAKLIAKIVFMSFSFLNYYSKQNAYPSDRKVSNGHDVNRLGTPDGFRIKVRTGNSDLNKSII